MNIDPMQTAADGEQEEQKIEDLLPMIHTSKSPSTISSKQSSRMVSPVRSPSSQSSVCVATMLDPPVIQLPTYLEREILIKINFDELSKREEKKLESWKNSYWKCLSFVDLVVDASVDEGVNGCCITSITSTSIDHCLEPGDFLISINHENMRKISNEQATAIIQRAASIGSDIR